MRALRSRKYLVLGLGALLVAASCSSNGESNKSSGESSGTAGSSVSSAPTGEPVVIGYINEEGTPIGSFPEFRQGALAAVDYINKQLGGLDHRPLQLAPCITDATPNSSANCARQLLAKKPLVVSGGLDFGSLASVPILEKAKMAYVGAMPINTIELTSPLSFQFLSGSIGGYAGMAKYLATEASAHTVSILRADIPAATYASNLIQWVLNKNGVKNVKQFSFDPSGADFTAVLTQATTNKPEAVVALAPSAVCSRLMTAKTNLGLDTHLYFADACLGEDTFKAGGGGANGTSFYSELILPESDDHQAQLFREQMKRYQPSAPIAAWSAAGFSSLMNIYNIAKTLPAGDLTTANMVQALKKTKDEPNFMAHPYTCDAKQVPDSPALCNGAIRMVRLENGKLVDLTGKWLDGTPDLVGYQATQK